MVASYSPLRYPGGKQVLFPALRSVIDLNGFAGGVYVEPYAGGAGAALALLFGEHVDKLILNDADPAIFSFWNSILNETEAFLRLVRDIPLNVDEWKLQREIYNKPSKASSLALGFATFYLNRCNRSGIIANAGVIGGLEQLGIWKINARFNRVDLERRISRVARYSERIRMHNMDAIEFLESYVNHEADVSKHFVYLDPPYFAKGSQLYLSYYGPRDHMVLAEYLKKRANFSWVLTYDDAIEIRNLYHKLEIVPFDLRYSASASRTGQEILISHRQILGTRAALFPRAS